MFHLRRGAAALLLPLALAAVFLPLAAAGAERHGCHCVVRMICCEEGTCTMGDEPPATGPEWRTCRRGASSALTSIDAFERALTTTAYQGDDSSAGRLTSVIPSAARYTEHIPATPPPRFVSF